MSTLLAMFGAQNAPRLLMVFAPNNCQAFKSDVRPHIDEDDMRLKDNLQELFIPGQNINIAALTSVLSALC